ncbi:related to aminopeptidase [Melanopsichium pennsylvanicum]|uniref:Peptide hydrolase n=2 Tax=Melanopsichium pennsylvanicum TaxID=63383 RepID=A0AAJ5C684_9BASI|nr:related to aminopeptidase [Melanopsichium pennsylvanicum 4]SNX85274.1 related to aminopeptidase [Melanopsichium pennsylvanicum]
MLAFTKHGRIAVGLALALAATTANAGPTVSKANVWTYWMTPASTPTSNYANLESSSWSCAVETALITPADSSAYFVHRAPSKTAHCIVDLSNDSPIIGDNVYPEVVLFKREPLSSNLQTGDEIEAWYWRSLSALSTFNDGQGKSWQESGQESFSIAPVQSWSSPEILSKGDGWMLLTVTEKTLASIDRFATSDTRIQRLAFRPTSSYHSLSPTGEVEIGFGVGEKSQNKKPEPKFRKPRHNDVIAKLVSSSALDPQRILKDVRILTGEDKQPKAVGEWHTRHSSTYGARLAGKWIKQQLEESLSRLNGSWCEHWEYSPYFAPNVVCHIASTATLSSTGSNVQSKEEDEALVVISAHFDSRGTFGSTTAPGGDDDASGTSALLGIARVIGSSQLGFKSPIQLVAFSGEEQGLVGSQYYAKHLSDSQIGVNLAIQMDMLAYRSPGEPMQIAFPDKLSTVSATRYVQQIAHIYAPQLEQGYTPACCSDHQSFWENNFPATWVFERNGPIADPMYHNSADTTDRQGYDVNQLAAIAKVVTATLLDIAAFHMLV